MLQRAVLLSAICLLAACGGKDSPSSPSQTRIPNYGGNWNGTYTVTGCNQTGGVALANICSSLGNTPPYQFNLTQSDRNVSGSFSLGSIGFPSTGGTVGQDGSLALSATSISNGITIVVNWALNLPATAIAGTITQNWQSSTLSGSVVVTGSINNAIRSNLAPSFAPRPPSSLDEAARRMNDR